jgi:hypothetical protein
MNTNVGTNVDIEMEMNMDILLLDLICFSILGY